MQIKLTQLINELLIGTGNKLVIVYDEDYYSNYLKPENNPHIKSINDDEYNWHYVRIYKHCITLSIHHYTDNSEDPIIEELRSLGIHFEIIPSKLYEISKLKIPIRYCKIIKHINELGINNAEYSTNAALIALEEL